MTQREELSHQIANLKRSKKLQEELLDGIKLKLNELEANLILIMENEGLQSFKDKDLGTFFLRVDTYASIEDYDKAFSWLREKGMGDVIKETVHAKTLAAIAKDNPQIEGVKITLKTQLGIRKGA